MSGVATAHKACRITFGIGAHMSAFGGKADMTFAPHMSANDPPCVKTLGLFDSRCMISTQIAEGSDEALR